MFSFVMIGVRWPDLKFLASIGVGGNMKLVLVTSIEVDDFVVKTRLRHQLLEVAQRRQEDIVVTTSEQLASKLRQH